MAIKNYEYMEKEQYMDTDPSIGIMETGYTDEYSQLKAVALHIPRKREVLVKDPAEVMFQAVPNYNRLLDEVDAYRSLLMKLGITVYDDLYFHDSDMSGPFPNLIYQRDLAVIAPNHIFLANPKYQIRKGEQEVLLTTLRRNGFIGAVVDLPENITMEGADFFWVDEENAIISVGNRTSPEFVEVFQSFYPEVNIRTVKAHPEGIPQHILGCKHIVDKDTLISRSSVNPDSLGFKNLIQLEETDEVVKGYAMNVVTVGPMEIIMPAGNPETKTIYEQHGLTVHESPAFEIGKMAGGFACMTLPIKRA